MFFASVKPGVALGDGGRDESFWGVGVGPVFALSSRVISFGWEASGSISSPFAHFSLGANYAVGGINVTHELPSDQLYFAWEPGYILGGTLGASISTSSSGSQEIGTPWILAGGWAGIPLQLSTKSVPDGDGYYRYKGWWASIAVGYRFIGGEHQLYFTPKINYYTAPSPNS